MAYSFKELETLTNTKETTTGAQTKATKALNDAKSFTNDLLTNGNAINLIKNSSGYLGTAGWSKYSGNISTYTIGENLTAFGMATAANIAQNDYQILESSHIYVNAHKTHTLSATFYNAGVTAASTLYLEILDGNKTMIQSMHSTPGAVNERKHLSFNMGAAGVVQIRIVVQNKPVGVVSLVSKIKLAETDISTPYSNEGDMALSIQTPMVTDRDGTAIILPAGSDLNEEYSTGWYRSANMINSPYLDWIYFEVIKHDSFYTLQNVYNYYTGDGFTRRKVGGVWSVWYKIMTSQSFSLVRNTYQSTALPSGGVAGEVWHQY